MVAHRAFDIQVDWETKFLNKAAKFVAILFWLSKEKEHICDRAYAQTTRFELAEWINKYGRNKKLKLLIGIEQGFSGERYIRKRINQDYPEIKIYNSLSEVCKDAVKKIS